MWQKVRVATRALSAGGGGWRVEGGWREGGYNGDE